ncbi:putative PurR-regulated permease PerM [Allofrancisella inopinata]|nr:putative PurR-regulated permease PerM [Allofrancisella inopinata]
MWILYPFIYPILFAGLLAIVLAPLQKYLEGYLNKFKSSLLITISILLCVFIPLITIVSYAINETIQYLQHTESLSQTLTQLSEYVSKIPYAGKYLQLHFNNIVDIIKQDQGQIITNLAKVLPAIKYVSFTSVNFIIDFLITILLLYQFLVSRNSLENFFRKIIFNEFNDKESFISTTVTTTRRVSLAIFSTAILVGIVMSITFIAVGLPSPVLFAFTAALTSMVPFLVTIIYIVISLGTFIFYGATKATIILIVGFVLNAFTDNIMQPKIINKEIKLSFVASLLGIMGGIQAFGFIGIFLGPIIFNVAYIGIEKLTDDKQTL